MVGRGDSRYPTPFFSWLDLFCVVLVCILNQPTTHHFITIVCTKHSILLLIFDFIFLPASTNPSLLMHLCMGEQILPPFPSPVHKSLELL